MEVVPKASRLLIATVDTHDEESDQGWKKLAVTLLMLNSSDRLCPYSYVAVVEGGQTAATQAGLIVLDSDVGTSRVVPTASRRKKEIADNHDAATATRWGRQTRAEKLVSSLAGNRHPFATVESR
jgi:hypothetical protein